MLPWPPPSGRSMDKALRYLSLAAKAGRLNTGAEDCAKALKKGKGVLLVSALDAAENTALQGQTMAAAGKGAAYMAAPYTKQQISQAVGRATPVALALICDKGLAEAFAAAVEKDREEQEERV